MKNLFIVTYVILNCSLAINCSNRNIKDVKVITNRRGETFTFHGNGTVSAIGPFNENLLTHRTNNDNPKSSDRIEIIKDYGNSVVYVGTLGLNGGILYCRCGSGCECKAHILFSSWKVWCYDNQNDRSCRCRVREENQNRRIEEQRIRERQQRARLEQQRALLEQQRRQQEEQRRREEEQRRQKEEQQKREAEQRRQREEQRRKEEEQRRRREEQRQQEEQKKKLLKKKKKQAKNKLKELNSMRKNIISVAQQTLAYEKEVEQKFKITVENLNFVNENINYICQRLLTLGPIVSKEDNKEANGIRKEGEYLETKNAHYKQKLDEATRSIRNEFIKLENKESMDKNLVLYIKKVIEQKKRSFDSTLDKLSKTHKSAKALKKKTKRLDKKIKKLEYYQKNDTFDGYNSSGSSSSESSSD